MVTVVPPEGGPCRGKTDAIVDEGRTLRETKDAEKSTALFETSTLTSPGSMLEGREHSTL
jgi:hypothetical protein